MQKYGTTDPISEAPPTEIDLVHNENLRKYLIECNLFESVEESKKREQVLGKLNVIVREWSFSVLQTKDLERAAKIFTFGSFRLGVHGPGADIDTLCVGPKQLDWNYFFEGLANMLRSHEEVTELTVVQDAYVPVIKMQFDGIAIDLLYSRLSLSSIPEDMDVIKDDMMLKNLDEKSVLSLNGCRVTDFILALVPNEDTFRLALRCIKLWAKKRNVYANVLGYLGGVSWAILVARVCQLYPNATASTIIHRFFMLYSEWKWTNPIMLNEIKHTLGICDEKVWNPGKNFKDRTHLMRIITPAYPAMNSTYNVSETTLNAMIKEFKRGLYISKRILEGSLPWKALVNPLDFFKSYQYFIQISITGDTEEEHRKWEGWIESRIRYLILLLERTDKIQYALPLCESFVDPANGGSYTSYRYLGLTFDWTTPLINPPSEKQRPGEKSVDLTPPVTEFNLAVNSWMQKSPGMIVNVKNVSRRDIPNFVIVASKTKAFIKKKRKRKVIPNHNQNENEKNDNVNENGK